MFLRQFKSHYLVECTSVTNLLNNVNQKQTDKNPPNTLVLICQIYLVLKQSKLGFAVKI